MDSFRQLMPTFKLRRFLPAILVAVHFIAVPCAMAVTAASEGPPCEHCDAALDQSPCMVSAAEPASGDQGPVTASGRPPPSRDVLLLRLPLPARTDSSLLLESPARSIGRLTGRHAGDPPLHVAFGKFLN